MSDDQNTNDENKIQDQVPAEEAPTEADTSPEEENAAGNKTNPQPSDNSTPPSDESVDKEDENKVEEPQETKEEKPEETETKDSTENTDDSEEKDKNTESAKEDENTKNKEDQTQSNEEKTEEDETKNSEDTNEKMDEDAKTNESNTPTPPLDQNDDDDDEDEEEEEIDLPEGEHKFQEKGTANKKVSGHIVINKKDDPRAKWYVVHTASGHEVRVAETLRQRVETQMLEDKIFELLVPTQDRVIIRSGKKQNIKEKIFPGYLLVKLILDDPTWLAVRTTPGITGFVGTGKTPTPLSDAEVANIQKFVATPAKRFKTKFTKGEAVKITDGPFSGFLGSVDEIDEQKGKVKVLVSIFGRETPVELDLLQITKV